MLLALITYIAHIFMSSMITDIAAIEVVDALVAWDKDSTIRA